MRQSCQSADDGDLGITYLSNLIDGSVPKLDSFPWNLGTSIAVTWFPEQGPLQGTDRLLFDSQVS
jgi:hypothetical protein